jgi:hypothetical protein
MESLSGLQNLAAVGRLDGARVLRVNLGESSHLLRGDCGVAVQDIPGYPDLPDFLYQG